MSLWNTLDVTVKCFRLAVDNLLFYSDLRWNGGHGRKQNLRVAFEYKYGLLVSEKYGSSLVFFFNWKSTCYWFLPASLALSCVLYKSTACHVLFTQVPFHCRKYLLRMLPSSSKERFNIVGPVLLKENGVSSSLHLGVAERLSCWCSCLNGPGFFFSYCFFFYRVALIL